MKNKPVFTISEIKTEVKKHPNWKLEDQSYCKTYNIVTDIIAIDSENGSKPIPLIIYLNELPGPGQKCCVERFFMHNPDRFWSDRDVLIYSDGTRKRCPPPANKGWTFAEYIKRVEKYLATKRKNRLLEFKQNKILDRKFEIENEDLIFKLKNLAEKHNLQVVHNKINRTYYIGVTTGTADLFKSIDITISDNRKKKRFNVILQDFKSNQVLEVKTFKEAIDLAEWYLNRPQYTVAGV